MMSDTQSAKDLLQYIVSTLVEDTSEMQIQEIDDGQSMTFELRVAKMDIGKIIGRQGRTADAIRTILNSSLSKKEKRCVLQIVDH